MKVFNCPNCGAGIQLDEKREFGFCSYCGTKIQLNETIIHKHTGTINLEGIASVNSLVKKGFLEIDSGDYFSAASTFDKALEINSNHILVFVGKMLTKISDDGIRKKAAQYIEFDPFYYKKIVQKSPHISEEESFVINENNCKLFLKCYCFFGDRERVNYVTENYPTAITLDILNSEHLCFYHLSYQNEDYNVTCYHNIPNKYYNYINTIIKEDAPVNVIDILLNSGISPDSIFKILYRLAYVAGEGHGHEIYRGKDKLNENMLPLSVMEKLVSAGLSLEQEVYYLYAPKAAYATSRERSTVSLVQLFSSEKYIEIPQSYREYFQQFKIEEKNGCYIATAVYGSYDCPQVWTLRRYRDNILAKKWYGHTFVHTYYAISPTLVKLFGHTDWFKYIWKQKLDKKVKQLNEHGVENTSYNDKQWY